MYQNDSLKAVVGARPSSFFEQGRKFSHLEPHPLQELEPEHIAHAIFSLSEYYTLPISLGWHVTNTTSFPGLTIQVPMWATALLEPSFLIYPCHAPMFQPPLFSAYVNGQLVNLEEVALLPYLYKDEYSNEDILVNLPKFLVNHDNVFGYNYGCVEIDKQLIRHHPTYNLHSPLIKLKLSSTFEKWKKRTPEYVFQRRIEMLFKA